MCIWCALRVLNGALNFELGLLDGYRFHHRHQGATDGHPAEFSLWRGRGLEIPPGPSLTQPHKVMVLWCDRGSVRDRVRPQTHDKRSANAFGHFLTAFAHSYVYGSQYVVQSNNCEHANPIMWARVWAKQCDSANRCNLGEFGVCAHRDIADFYVLLLCG